MVVNKLSSQIQIALRYENLLTPETTALFVKDQILGIWDVIVQYVDDIEKLQEKYEFEVFLLGQGYAELIIQRSKIPDLTNEPSIIYISVPQSMEFTDINLTQVCAQETSLPSGGYNVTGRQFLLAVIDSGINYMHNDFRNEDGTTRIKYLWDQSIPGSPPPGFKEGTVYTKEQINAALKANTKEETLSLIPSVDKLGHGTAMAGVAGGNGRASVGRRNRGMATECEFIIVKVKRSDEGLGPSTLELMQGLHFALVQAKALQIPLVVLFGSGYNMANHNGDGVLAKYIESVYKTWICNVVVGMGNEADRGSHFKGNVKTGEEKQVEILVESGLVRYAFSIWNPISDELEIVIQSPTGERTDRLSILTPNRAYIFDRTAVIINFTEPAIDNTQNEIFVTFQGQNGEEINKGLWKVTVKGVRILEGQFNIWTKLVPDRLNKTKVLSPELNTTLTIPADSKGLTSVGAYNGSTMQLAGFSGRGYTTDGRVKPEIVAPGINVTVPSTVDGELYTTASGTSIAAAFVAGAYILMQAYGIVQLGNTGLYGDVLEIYLIRNANRPIANAPYPNVSWGYGMLCLEASLNNMRDVANKTT